MRRLPEHTKPLRGGNEELHRVKSILRGLKLHTVCESARCPNLGECFGRKTATFMIMGDICTRSCFFCAVRGGQPAPLDPEEPARLALAANQLRLKHVVITSVTRDDLNDGGAAHFVKTIEAVRETLPGTSVEVLVPDVKGIGKSLDTVIRACPDVFNHNVETVPRLYPEVRPNASYARSISVIGRAAGASLKTKSGLMLGMGEDQGEVVGVMQDLLEEGCKMLTLGQYLRPTRRNRPVVRYLEPEEFEEYRIRGEEMGFERVFAGPLIRSSYRADTM